MNGDAKEITNEIVEVVDSIRDRGINDFTGDELTRAAGKLAVLQFSLGGIVAKAMFDSNFAYVYRKFKSAEEFRRLRLEVDSKKLKEIENEVQVNLWEDMQKENRARYEADVLKALYDDTERLIGALQTRVSWLKTERINSQSQQ